MTINQIYCISIYFSLYIQMHITSENFPPSNITIKLMHIYIQYRKINEYMKQNSFSFLTLLDSIYVFIAITALQNAKICILCSSYYRKPLQLTEMNRKHFPLLSTRCHSKCLCKSNVHFCNVVVPTSFLLVYLELYLIGYIQIL